MVLDTFGNSPVIKADTMCIQYFTELVLEKFGNGPVIKADTMC